MPMLPSENTIVNPYTMMQVPITNGPNPRSLPSSRSAGAQPHSAGLRRPQL